jgi:hypothetical protein
MRDLFWMLFLIAFAVSVVAKNLPDLGSKHPDEEEVIFTAQRNLVTGELRRVEIIRCRYCHQVISFVEFDHTGKPIGGHISPTHRCGYKWGSHEPYAGLGVVPNFNFWKWLDGWQKRLSRK